MRSAPILAACFWALSWSTAVQAREDPSTVEAPTRQELDQVREWIQRHPDSVATRTERRERIAVIDRACDALPQETFKEYCKAWEDSPSRANELERDGVLYYLHQARNAAIEDIRRTQLKKGVAIWHLYNMGYVFKTPESCFGIDIYLRDAKDLAPDLDFLLVTHEHRDHKSDDLIAAMIAAKKPVLARFACGGPVIKEPCEFKFGAIRVKVDLGDHRQKEPARRNDMLMFQVDCGASGNDRVIYHSGDGSNFLKMTPDKPVDVFIVHVNMDMRPDDAISHLKPKTTLVSHVQELGHALKPPKARRWSYAFAFKAIRNTTRYEALVLTWGERWLVPGTELVRAPAHPKGEVGPPSTIDPSEDRP